MTGIIGPGLAIDRGIPMPPPDGRAGRNGRPRRWRWEKLEIGESFLTTNMRLVQMSLHWALTNGRTFTSRKTNKGFRVWRTA